MQVCIFGNNWFYVCSILMFIVRGLNVYYYSCIYFSYCLIIY